MGASISRRQLSQGAVWSVPAVAMAQAAPALAASPVATLTSSTRFDWSNTSTGGMAGYSCSGKAQLRVSQQSSLGSFLTVSGVTSGAALTSLSTTFWVAVDSGTTFKRNPATTSSTCWTVPAATGASTVYNGVTFYAYTTNFTCPITVTGTSWSLPTAQYMDFVSSCQSASTLKSLTVHYTQVISVNGTPVAPKDNGWANAMSSAPAFAPATSGGFSA